MTSDLSLNARAILLLTAPLIAETTSASRDLLAPREYKQLARHLRDINCQPADLVSSDAAPLLRACHPIIDESRLQRLLGRGFLLTQVLERWRARAIWVVSRADADYPRRLKARLREDAPAVLYGCGEIILLESGGLAVVGSRFVDDSLINYTVSVGQLAARAGRTLVSGGAKGIDQAAMRGALEAGGKVSGVLADSLERTSLNREHRNLLLDGRLVLVSPYDPSAGFNVGNAMQRNKLIYALADASLVVNSDLNKGGTWAGATEQLDKLNFVPVYVRSTGEPSPGLDALRKKGALSWPNPPDTVLFESVFDVTRPSAPPPPQVGLSLFSEDGASNTLPAARAVREAPPSSTQESVTTVGHANETATPESNPAEALFATVREIMHRLLTTPMKDAAVAAALDVSTAQAKVWLNRLVEEGSLEKQKKPAGYVAKQKRLFE
jgi:predicted Rossmann fold nucleotide-binding protein DprA/Smf involved in DNA uptake